ncbi:MAG: hypothetical protein SQA66_16745 [Candidatus Fervidibacter sacchari]
MAKTKAKSKGNEKVKPSEWLQWYEHHLRFWLWCMRKYRRCEPEEADVVLFTREDLWEAMKREPNGLTKEERKKLRELDRELKAHAHWMAKALPDLPKIRKRLKPPRSHWWWFLDKLAEKGSGR